MEKLIILPVIMVCLMRTISYGVYTIRDQNKTGAMGIFVMASAVALASVYFLMK